LSTHTSTNEEDEMKIVEKEKLKKEKNEKVNDLE